MKFSKSIHNHTWYCGHSDIKIEDSINFALKNNFRTWGISEHIPHPDWSKQDFSNWYEIYWRCNMPQFENLVKEIEQIKKDIPEEIEFLFGLECECSGINDLKWMQCIIDKYQIDYVICGMHLPYEMQPLKSPEWFELKKESQIWQAFKTQVDFLFEHKDFFTCLNHPDFAGALSLYASEKLIKKMDHYLIDKLKQNQW